MIVLQFLYDSATWLAQPLVRLKLRRRGRAEPGYLQAVPERFGQYHDAPARPEPSRGAPLVWIHAVSLGETRAAAVLLPQLRAQWPDMRLLLTNGTATGRAEGQHLLKPGDVQVWQPWDTRAATTRFVRHYRPDLGVLMETEVWPNLVRACRAAGVPLVLANARLSERSMRGTLRAGRLLCAAYASLSAVYAQTEDDAVRLRQVGAAVEAVHGNLKFDAQPPPAMVALGERWRETAGGRAVVLLASSRSGEEFEFFRSIKASEPDPSARPAIENVVNRVQWLVVPRHPQRFDDVEALALNEGLTVSRRSTWQDAPLAADVWLGDSLGEMAAYYTLADVALLGGSFAPLGGQNLIEAAACGCPVVMGPHTFNFTQAAELALRADAALRAPDLPEGLRLACALAADRTRHSVLAKAGRVFARRHEGAAAHTAQSLRQWVNPAPSGRS